MRGEARENRIKEIKNKCFSDRLSCHSFWANFFWLFLSVIVYEFFRGIKQLLQKTSHEKVRRWQVDNLRLFLLKVGASVIRRVRTIFSGPLVNEQLAKNALKTNPAPNSEN